MLVVNDRSGLEKNVFNTLTKESAGELLITIDGDVLFCNKQSLYEPTTCV